MFFKRTFFGNFVPLIIFFNLVNADEDSPSVIIVGAGASGIAAASKLYENGFKNVKILEAENRIGGRVFTTKFNDYLVDLGGQWVHGEEGNVAFELAWPLGVLEKEGLFTTLNFAMFDSSGNLINQTSSDDLMSLFFKLKVELDDYSKKSNGSIGEFFFTELNKYFKDHPEWNQASEGVLHLFNMIQMANDAGDTWWDVSTSTISEFKDSAGDYSINWKDRGYGTILDILMKRFPNIEHELPVLNNTMLNMEVSSIDYKDAKNGKVTVKTTNGNTYYADHVIVTCSLGVLKDKQGSLFQPPLSEEKQKTIKGLGFGSEAKILLSFENPVWTNYTYVGFNALWKKEDIEELEKDPERRWLLGIVGFFFVEHKPRLLFSWVSGNYSREMEKLSDQQVFNQTVEMLHRFVGNHLQVPTPTGMIRTMWNSNKNFQGTYSFRSLKSDDDNVWSSTLAEPIGDNKPVIMFAGEATSPNHYSTVHGAIETGWREADRLIKHHPNLAKN